MSAALVEVDEHGFVTANCEVRSRVIRLAGCRHLYVLEERVVLHFSRLDDEDSWLGVVLGGDEEVAIVVREVGVDRRSHRELVIK